MKASMTVFHTNKICRSKVICVKNVWGCTEIIPWHIVFCPLFVSFMVKRKPLWKVSPLCDC